MKERPILFSAPMIRALLAGKKTQTRRIVKWPPGVLEFLGGSIDRALIKYGGGDYPGHSGHGAYVADEDYSDEGSLFVPCPYGVPGDRLWVRETFTHITGNGIRTHYRADGEPTGRDGSVLPTEPGLPRWRPSIFMPRKESRITLDVAGVRVERLHAITEADAWAEGIDEVDGELEDAAICRAAKVIGCGYEDARATYGALWADINGEDSLIANPWVWAITFKEIRIRRDKETR